MLSAIKQIYVPHKTRTIPFPPAILSVFVFVQFLAFLKIVHTNNAYVTMDKTQKKGERAREENKSDLMVNSHFNDMI